jgi:hypothetical protein
MMCIVEQTNINIILFYLVLRSNEDWNQTLS